MEYSRFRQRMEKQGKTGEYNGIYRSRNGVRYRVHLQDILRRNREKGLPDNYVMIVQNMYDGGELGENQCTWAVKKSQNVAEMNEGVNVDERSYQAGQNKE